MARREEERKNERWHEERNGVCWIQRRKIKKLKFIGAKTVKNFKSRPQK